MSDLAAEIVIVGAGPTGASLALALAQAGIETALVDARNPDVKPRPDTRNFAVVTGSWHLLKAIGVAQKLDGLTTPLHGLEAVDGGSHVFGAPSILFADEDLPDRPEGETLGQMIEAADLQAALDEAMRDLPGLQWLAPAQFTGFDTSRGGLSVRLDSGQLIRTRLLVGADGVNSPVRQAAGITVEGRDYDKSVLATNVKLSKPHEGIARQLFTPEGPFATLPLKGNRANLAWYMKRGAAEALCRMPAEEIEAELNYRFADFAGDMRLEGPVGSYPLFLQIAERMVDDRVALVGDAVRRVIPLAGQGLNQGFRDVAALYDAILEGDRAGLDVGARQNLDTYQSSRRFAANSSALAMDALDRLFSNDHAIMKPVRSLGLMAASRIRPVRERLARIASAASPGLPSLMQPR